MNLQYQFTQGMWFEESSMANVLFDTQLNNRYNAYCNKNMARMTFINNNTFADYLHSKGMVQLFHLDL